MNLGNRLTYAIFRGLAALACRLDHDRALSVGVTVADALGALYARSPVRDVVPRTILAAYPQWDRKAADALLRSHLRQLLMSIVEILRFPVTGPADLAHLAAWDGREHIEEALRRGKGAIILSAHFGNWEVMAAALTTIAPVSVLVQPPSQGAFERLFIEARDRFGIPSHPNTGPASLRPLLRALGRNEIVALLADQHGEAQDAVATLYDHPVSVPAGPFFIAEKTGAPVLPTFTVRDRGSRHTVRVLPPLTLGDPDQSAQAYCDALEAAVRAHPDHWLWVHDRWAREHELRRLPRVREVVG